MKVRVGVLMMQPPGPRPSYAYIEANTYAWLKKAGATIVPIPPTVSAPEAAAYFDHVHGLYLHEGWADQPAYAALVRTFLIMATEANRAGDYFPIWGTCQGLQRLMVFVGGKLEPLDAKAFTTGSRFNLFGHPKDSRLLGHATRAQLRHLQEHYVPHFNHEYGISLRRFMKTPCLQNSYRVLATSHDRGGKEYLSLIEATNFPYYGAQFHPEMAADLGWMADFFVREMRRSRHRGFCPGLLVLQAGECEEAGSMISCLRLRLQK